MRKYLLTALLLILVLVRMFFHMENNRSIAREVGFDWNLDKEPVTNEITQFQMGDQTKPLAIPIVAEIPKVEPKELDDELSSDTLSLDTREVYDPVCKKYYALEKFNALTAKELMHFKGIGEKTAASIIEYRNTYGTFQSFSELVKIKGIGEKKLESILLNSR